MRPRSAHELEGLTPERLLSLRSLPKLSKTITPSRLLDFIDQEEDE